MNGSRHRVQLGRYCGRAWCGFLALSCLGGLFVLGCGCNTTTLASDDTRGTKVSRTPTSPLKEQGASKQRLPFDMICGLDCSQSREKQHFYTARYRMAVVEAALPSGSRVADFALLRRAEEIRGYENEPAADSETALSFLATRFPAQQPGRRTDPTAFWEAALRLHTASGRPERALVILLETDGDDDFVGPEQTRKMQGLVKRLCALPQLRRIYLVGVTAANRERLRREFSPLADRFQILDTTTAPETLVQKLAEIAPGPFEAKRPGITR